MAYLPPDNNAFNFYFERDNYKDYNNNEFNVNFHNSTFIQPNNDAFNVSFILSYTPPNNNAFNFNFTTGGGGTIYIQTMNDVFSFNDSLEAINIILQNISDIFSLSGTLADIIPMIGINDEFGLNDLLDGFNIIPTQIVDIFGLNDILDGKRIVVKSGSDVFAFNDVLVGKNIIYRELLSKFGLNEVLSSLDFIIYWSCRTKIPRLGYGGTAYGDVVGYGEGEVLDIIKYIFEIINESGVVVRQEDILITDPENPDVIYWYDSQKNIDDNTTWQQNLTFNIYQMNSKGVVSEVQTISMFKYKFWRLYITATLGPAQTYTTVADLILKESHYEDTFCINGIATADSSYSGDLPANAFDSNPATKHSSSSALVPHWIKYQLNLPKHCVEYSITAQLSDVAYQQRPKTWKLQGSNDNVIWVDVDSQTNIIFASGETKTFFIS